MVFGAPGQFNLTFFEKLAKPFNHIVVAVLVPKFQQESTDVQRYLGPRNSLQLRQNPAISLVSNPINPVLLLGWRLIEVEKICPVHTLLVTLGYHRRS